MKNYTRLSLVGSVWACLLMSTRLLLAGHYTDDGQIGTISDNKTNFAAGGWLSVVGEGPFFPWDGLAASQREVAGDGEYWDFSYVTLRANGGFTDSAAKQVSIRLGSPEIIEHEHLVDPHTDKPPGQGNVFSGIESPKKDLGLGNSDVYSAWRDDPHFDSHGEHADYYTVGGTVSYNAGGCCGRILNTLATEDAWVRASHDERPAHRPEDSGPGGQVIPIIFSAELRFDPEWSRITLSTFTFSGGGVSPDDPIRNVTIQEMNFQLDGQDESGAWRFSGGHFALSTPWQEIVIEGEIDDLFIYEIGWGESYGVLNRGGAIDGTQGMSPWMNQFNAALAGQAETGVPGTTYGTPTIWLNSEVDLVQATAGFTMSADCIPVEISLAPSLLETEDEELSGDYNGDGVINAADSVVWRKTMGQTGPGLLADGNGNGEVDLADGDLWSSHFGETDHLGAAVAASANGVAVPEPASALLLVFAAALGYRRRRRATAATIIR